MIDSNFVYLREPDMRRYSPHLGYPLGKRPIFTTAKGVLLCPALLYSMYKSLAHLTHTKLPPREAVNQVQQRFSYFFTRVENQTWCAKKWKWVGT